MRDLVDRSRVMNDLFEAHPIGFNNDDIADAFKNAPCVYAVEVVRCGNCMHREVFFNDPTLMFCHKWLRTMETDLNFYCAHGTKMDAEVEK